MDYNEKIDIDKTLLNNELLLKLCPQYRNLLNLIFFIRNFEVFNVYLFSLKKKKRTLLNDQLLVSIWSPLAPDIYPEWLCLFIWTLSYSLHKYLIIKTLQKKR